MLLREECSEEEELSTWEWVMGSGKGWAPGLARGWAMVWERGWAKG